MKKAFGNTYNGKKVLITGNTGFKGSWLSIWLKELGAEVYGLSNGIPTNPSMFEACGLNDRIKWNSHDVRDLDIVRDEIEDIKPDFVFHLAAQPIVSLSYSHPIDTIETNVLGTLNVLEALRLYGKTCNAVMITSDKCYENNEWVWGYRENDKLGGKDPYSASKACAENIIKCYVESFFSHGNRGVKVVSARAGNVIGGGDWARDRIVPDCMRAWVKGEAVKIRNPNATRPWQHVLEPLSGYLLLGQKLNEDESLNGEAFNFGPTAPEQNYTVLEMVEELKENWGYGKVEVVDESVGKEHYLLKLCCDKALEKLKWNTTLAFDELVSFTSDWYKKFYDGKEDMYKFTVDQIQSYWANAYTKKQRLAWTN